MKLRLVLSAGLLLAAVSFSYAQEKADFSKVPGTVIAHLPASSRQFIGSPSICKLPDGTLLASHDLFGPGSTEHVSAVSRIYRSIDKGKSWQQISEIDGQFWSKLFLHNDKLYLMGTNRHHGNTIIRYSADGGVTWTNPTDSNNGLLLEGEYHCAPMAPIIYKGRLWRAMEDAMGPVKKWGKRYGAFMLSMPIDADPMKAGSWTVSNVLPYDSTYLDGNFGGWVEGNALVAPDGGVVDVLRVDDRSTIDEKAAIVRISDDGKTASFDRQSGFIHFPGGGKKFTIRYDSVSRRYWTLSNYIPARYGEAAASLPKKVLPPSIRNTLALCSSSDLVNWQVHRIVLQSDDIVKTGFQYVDWFFDGKNIVFASRTGYPDGLGGANNAHNANFLTFHIIKKFRKYQKKKAS